MATAAPTNVAEYIRSLSPEEKEAALAELITEAIIAAGGEGPIPVRKPNGESLGYYVPPSAAQEHLRAMLSRLTPEQRARGNRALEDVSRTFDMDEFLDELSREDPD
jgi:hypothetical protein